MKNWDWIYLGRVYPLCLSYRTSRGHPPIPGIRPPSPSISLTVLPISIQLGWSVVLSQPYRFTCLQHFHGNLCISPHTFDVLISLIQDHPSFQNDSPLDQWPIPYQLTIALFWFGHFGSATSVNAVAQWAGCSTGTVINATQHVITAFLPLHDQAI